MSYKDLRDFIAGLERDGQLKRISVEVDPRLEMTAIADRVLRAGGPALLFENPKGHRIPVLANLFGTVKRVALGMGEDDPSRLREVGKLLAYLKEPEPPKGLRDAWDRWPVLKQVLNMAPKEVRSAPCQEIVWEGADVDLNRLPKLPPGANHEADAEDADAAVEAGADADTGQISSLPTKETSKPAAAVARIPLKKVTPVATAGARPWIVWKP